MIYPHVHPSASRSKKLALIQITSKEKYAGFPLALTRIWLYNKVIHFSSYGGRYVKYRLFALLLACLLCVSLAAFAEDTGYDICYEDFMASASSGGKPMVLYTARTISSLSMRSKPDKTSEALGVLNERGLVKIWGYDQEWLFCWSDEVGVYYIARRNVTDIEPVSSDIPPYGVIKNRFIAHLANDSALRSSPDHNAEPIEIYPAGTRVSFWMIHDGWAVVPYNRLVGYFYVGDLVDLTPVTPNVHDAERGDILAAFSTFYSTKTTELNVGRMENLRVGCEYISKVYQPGEAFDFNKTAGPYRRSRGYMPSPVLIDGGTVAGYGGGTCQVSTTLYNALLQLPDGITILWRRPHGPGGAKYAPHGVDAAVGAQNLNLEFRNDYAFPITLDCSVMNGILCICVRKA